MNSFGVALRTLRQGERLTQSQLAKELGFGRSTLANIEAGREASSPRFWEAVCEKRSGWEQVLEPLRSAPSDGQATSDREPRSAEWILGGPFLVENLTFVYVFEHSRSPSEIIEARRVRATRNGADSYGLKLVKTPMAGFESSEEALWGGSIETQLDSARGYVRRFRFDHVLRRGQRHEFATRQWVERDPEPGTAIAFTMTIPAAVVSIHLHFRGPERPRRTLRFGPLADDADMPEAVPLPGGASLRADGSASEYFRDPQPGASYGLAWEW